MAVPPSACTESTEHTDRASTDHTDRARVDLVVTPLGQGARITGRLDARSVADIWLALHRALAEGCGDLRLDLEEAELGDRAALGLLLECHLRARRQGRRLVLGQLTPRTERLLRAARLLAAAPAGTSTLEHTPAGTQGRDPAPTPGAPDPTVVALTA